MCIGESGADTLHGAEQRFLRAVSATEFPAHAFAIHGNDDGQVWVVLEPSSARPDLPRFTICRIDPCVLVMVEDHGARRQFCSTSNVEDAVAFVRHATGQAVLAVMNAHPASPVLH